MKRYKYKWRLYSIVGFEKEEQFLREQHKQGLKLVSVCLPGIYKFEPCPKEDVIYQLDLSDVKMSEKENYLQLFRDCHWEYMFNFMGWDYFRKPVATCDNNESIFSDVESKIQLLNRICYYRLVPLLIILFSCIIPQLFMQLEYYSKNPEANQFNLVLFILYLLLLSLYSYILTSFSVQLYRLKQKYFGKN